MKRKTALVNVAGEYHGICAVDDAPTHFLQSVIAVPTPRLMQPVQHPIVNIEKINQP